MELPVRVTLLGETPRSFDTAIVTLTARELQIRLGVALALRAPLKIESPDQMWLGEVIETHQDGTAWLAAVRIDHSLRDLADLTRLAERFAGKSERAADKTPVRAVP